MDWIGVLSGTEAAGCAARTELRAFLIRGLCRAFLKSGRADPALIDDIAQDALVRIEANLDSFRGDSAFLTWAMAIAVREGLRELRRARWKDISLEQAAATVDLVADDGATPEDALGRARLGELLQQLIRTELTERQRLALEAELGGMPLDEIARVLGTNRGALYKLLHDTRKRLKHELAQHGISLSDVSESR
jgi:RNA polymerase sigma-70 factor (ECF subfamily)